MTPIEHDLLERIAQAREKGEKPAPLTPKDCDVTNYPAFMLFCLRLRRSDFWTTASPTAKVAAIDLLTHAWHEVPAGSLPNDMRCFQRATGLSQTRLKRLIAEGPLRSPFHGWIECSDGRLYHPVLCADALRCWELRKKGQAAANERWKRTSTLQHRENDQGFVTLQGALRRRSTF